MVEEKQSRIVEILLATVPARAILAGKVLGCSLLAFTQVALYAAAGLLGLAINGDELNLDGLGAPILWFVVLFIFAFISLAALYGAAASLVSRQEDLSAASSPIMMLIMIPYFLIIMFSNNETVLAVMSYIPFSAPVAVPLRVYLDSAAPWENFVSLGILVVTAVLCIQLASAIYERSVLKMGAAVKWSQALKKKRQFPVVRSPGLVCPSNPREDSGGRGQCTIYPASDHKGGQNRSRFRRIWNMSADLDGYALCIDKQLGRGIGGSTEEIYRQPGKVWIDSHTGSEQHGLGYGR